MCVCVIVCVCMCARARACVFHCVLAQLSMCVRLMLGVCNYGQIMGEADSMSSL